MSFGLNNCAILTIVNGKPVEATILDDFPWLPHDEGYKYLGILESSDFHMKKIKITATKEYISQVRKVLKAQLSASIKKLHVHFFVQQREILQVNLDLLAKWMTRTGLSGGTEAALCAAME